MDRFLAQRFKKGDKNAFKELYSANFDNALRLAAAITKNTEMAKDAVQTSFIRAYDYRKSFNPQMEFIHWYNRILINECKRALSKDQKNPVVYIDDYTSIKKSTLDSYRFEKYEMLYDALQNLKDDLRIPILLKYINDFSEAEIAETLDLKYSTVKSRLYEGRQKIKKALEQKGYKEYLYE
ncbi:MAG: sigma-70 family RNA polymerase sigma factor [Eubacteriales bacterium]